MPGAAPSAPLIEQELIHWSDGKCWSVGDEITDSGGVYFSAALYGTQQQTDI